MRKRIELIDALELFDDDENGMTSSERMNILRRAFMDYATKTMLLVAQKGLKFKIAEEEEYVHQECLKQFKVIEKMYNSEVRESRIKGNTSGKMNTDFLAEVRKMKSSIGAIETSTKGN